MSIQYPVLGFKLTTFRLRVSSLNHQTRALSYKFLSQSWRTFLIMFLFHLLRLFLLSSRLLFLSYQMIFVSVSLISFFCLIVSVAVSYQDVASSPLSLSLYLSLSLSLKTIKVSHLSNFFIHLLQCHNHSIFGSHCNNVLFR